MLTSSVLAVILASVAAAQQPAKTIGNIFVDMAPFPTAPALLRRGPDYECISSIATEVAPVSSVDPALSSYLEHYADDMDVLSSCIVTLPNSLTSDFKSVYSSLKTWASTVSSKAAGIHTDCGNGAPITVSLTYGCTDKVEVVATASGEDPKTETLSGITGPTEVVIGEDSGSDSGKSGKSAGNRAVVSWGALAAAVGVAALL